MDFKQKIKEAMKKIDFKDRKYALLRLRTART